MQVRIFTLRFNPMTESFDEGVVASFLADKEVLSINDHFFLKDDVPYLTLVVRYRATAPPAPAKTARPQKKRDESWREILTEADWPLFNTLFSTPMPADPARAPMRPSPERSNLPGVIAIS